ncbi:MAG: RidA family protein [Lewinellaceae bacterium]|nr:RidA family protein [Lewinellaceae bacterium]
MIESQLKKLDLELPAPPPLGGIYHPVVITGNMLYVSGQAPRRTDGSLITGVVGKDLSMEEAKAAARQTGLTMLATIRSQIGDLDRIKRLIKTLGMVNCEQGFTNQPQVINGFSELWVELLGEENGKGARSAVGMILPGNIAVEIEAIFELH